MAKIATETCRSQAADGALPGDAPVIATNVAYCCTALSGLQISAMLQPAHCALGWRFIVPNSSVDAFTSDIVNQLNRKLTREFNYSITL